MVPAHESELERWQSLVPLPTSVVPGRELWTLPPNVLVDWGPVRGTELESLSERLDLMLAPLSRSWRTALAGERPAIRFESGGGSSEYDLVVAPAGARILSSVPEGRYHGLVTLSQLLPPRVSAGGAAVSLTGEISDSPAFSWRGLMLDSSRHFQSVSTVEWVLELMAQHKLNRFHWHLTDDQGWRFPVDGWPLLTEVGAWRKEVGMRYGGFYTHEQIRHIVSYAARRHIVVVPEVDLPGHSSAALAAYPELSAAGTAREVPLEWGVADGVLSIGRRSVSRFTEDTLATLVKLFPGKWIHWGGDEVYRTPWMRNTESLAWMKSVRASTPEQALAAFWRDLARKTLAAGRVPVGWDEVALQSPPPGTIVQWWDDPNRGVAAVDAGYSIIGSWKESSYLDYPEWAGDGDRAGWMPVQDLTAVSQHPFWPPGTPASKKPLLLGIEAELWTERAEETKIGRKLFPRLALFADLAWTAVQGGAPQWALRVSAHRERLTAWGVGMPPPLR